MYMDFMISIGCINYCILCKGIPYFYSVNCLTLTATNLRWQRCTLDTPQFPTKCCQLDDHSTKSGEVLKT